LIKLEIIADNCFSFGIIALGERTPI